MVKKSFVLVLTVVFVMVLSVSAIAKKPIVLKLAENQPVNNPVTVADEYFAELVKEKTNGNVIVEVYPGAVLGEEVDSIQQVRAGVIAMARVNTVPLAEFIPEVGVFTLPYIFANTDHKWEVLDGPIGNSVLESFEKAGLVGLNYYEAGSRNFYTVKKPIKSLADLKGLKIRVQPSEISLEMVRLLGGIPTPLSYGEVYSALQTGVIDGAENDFVSYYTSSHYEVAPYYTLDGHLSPPAVTIMNKDIFYDLPKEYQQAILEAAKEAQSFEIEEMLAFEEESREIVVAAGVQIFEVDVVEFQEAVEPIYDMYPEYTEIIEQIRALQ
ncbi:C4-dicarboxylate ABC transporter [Petrotoga sp. HWH.PT.55.6.1]|uniref:TRAP transporter substrate-binding protein n=1 Tax=unclassified Petrotoga TaxID=2620614 RepID=UPI000CA08B5E|nr:MULTISPECIES: TRAP transporter substrate-binding protein [unclassified Petrotoga]RPD35538.1 C4-dicarboxylate ABC transporter [Petrotoga sp. HWH.PT.55.6.1]